MTLTRDTRKPAVPLTGETAPVDGRYLKPVCPTQENDSVTRTALITGVGRRRGIGAGLAAGLAADGWDLVLSFWRPYDERLGLAAGPNDPQGLAEELRSLGVQVELAPIDLADPVGPQALIDTAVTRFGPLDAVRCRLFGPTPTVVRKRRRS